MASLFMACRKTYQEIFNLKNNYEFVQALLVKIY